MFGGPSRFRRITIAAVVLHALVLLAAPFEHHDLVCHLKTPQHCTSCVASPVSAGAVLPVTALDRPLADAGVAHVAHERESSVPGPLRVPGRSPPERV
jgi:hypothetical protein